jgi:1-acyl-sn-glycerol-3-phosphate acyltransferase
MRLIYLFFRLLTWLGLTVFYRKRLVLGRENLCFKGPAIVVSNHPSTLMDPLNVGLQVRQEMFFLANYSLFKHPVSNWLLSRLFSIPVKRKEDVAEGEQRNNDAAFEASFRHLEGGGVLYIAAEGVSWMNRFVRPFKTGAARIALGAEKRNGWQLGVKIIPVGLSYDAPNLFRSRVTVEYGAPIEAATWSATDAESHDRAIEAFTAQMENAVRALTLDSGSEENDAFLSQAEDMLRHASSDLSDREQYFSLKSWFAQNRHDAGLRGQMAEYFDLLDKNQLSDAGMGGKIPWYLPAVLLLGLPFFCAGYAFWFLPCWLPWSLARHMNLYIGYDSNVKMLSGLLLFPLAFWGAWEGVHAVSTSKALAWSALPALAALGYWAEWWSDQFRLWRELSRAHALRKKRPDVWGRLHRLREGLLFQLRNTTPPLS